MKYIGIIILLVLCLTWLFFTKPMINTVTPDSVSGDLENQEDIDQSSNNSQNSSTDLVDETVIVATEEPVIVNSEDPEMVYPQKWATGTGIASNPWANNCIQKAYDFVPDGGTIYLKAGYYTLSNTLSTNKKINIVGEGRNRSIILLNIAHGNGIEIATDYCALKGFTIDGDSQTDGEKYLAPISITDCDYAVLEDIEVKNAGYYGINIYQVNHSSFQNIYTHDNYRHGLHPGSDRAGRNMYNTYRDIYAWNNGLEGFDDRGSTVDPELKTYNVYDGLNCWDNGQHGIYIAYQSGGVLSNSSASGNGKHGIYLADVEDFEIHDCSVTLSGEDGVYIYSSKNVNVMNVIAKNNNTSDTYPMSGIRIDHSNDIRFTSCQSYDDRDTPLQGYGIGLIGVNTNISLNNCKLTPNKEGEIYNPAGLVLTLITEKRKFLLPSL